MKLRIPIEDEELKTAFSEFQKYAGEGEIRIMPGTNFEHWWECWMDGYCVAKERRKGMQMNIDKILDMIKTLKLSTTDILDGIELVRKLSIEVGEISTHLAKTAEISKDIVQIYDRVSKRKD